MKKTTEPASIDWPQPPTWLRLAPGNVIFGPAAGIQAWARIEGLPVPTLLELAAERRRRNTPHRQATT